MQFYTLCSASLERDLPVVNCHIRPEIWALADVLGPVFVHPRLTEEQHIGSFSGQRKSWQVTCMPRSRNIMANKGFSYSESET